MFSFQRSLGFGANSGSRSAPVRTWETANSGEAGGWSRCGSVSTLSTNLVMSVNKSNVGCLSLYLCTSCKPLFADLSSPSLDSSTAHPKVEISQDSKQVYWRQQPASDSLNHQPYDSQYSVLTKDSFTTGHHYWEVIVQDKPYWLIGMTTELADKNANVDVRRCSLDVNNTSWCIYHGDGQYLACHDTQEKQLHVRRRVRKMGILANLQKGELSFYDSDSLTLLHSFCVQCTKPLYPMLNPCIDVNGLNKQPLTLFWITDT